MKVQPSHKPAVTQPKAGPESETATGEGTQPPEPEFEEPAAAEDREDLSTDVAPSRLDVPIDPHTPRRAVSPECCSLPDEERPEATALDRTA